MFDKHANFVYSTIATAPSPAISGTNLVIQSGDASNFPATPFNATCWPSNVPPILVNAEIVRVTNITGATLTITRAQEGTSAISIAIGYQIAATITLKTLTDIENSIGQMVYNVKDPAFGAKGDTIKLFDGAITSGSATLTSASANFTSADIGKQINVTGAGPVQNQGYNPIKATISTIVSPTSVTLSSNAAHTVSGAIVIYGSNDTAAILAAGAAAFNAGGGIVYCPPGGYRGLATGYAFDTIYVNSGVILAGAGIGATTLYLGLTFGTTVQGASSPLIKSSYLRDLTIDGSGADLDSSGISYRNASECRVKNVYVNSIPAWSIIGAFEYGVPFSPSVYFENCVFDRGVFVNNEDEQDMSALNAINYVKFDHCEFRNNMNGYSTLLTYGPTQELVLNDIRFVNCSGANTIIGCNCVKVTIDGLRCDGGAFNIQAQDLSLNDVSDTVADMSSYGMHISVKSAHALISNVNIGQADSGSSSNSSSSLLFYEHYINQGVEEKYVNTANSGQNQITFTGVPNGGFANGMTVWLDRGTANFEAVIIASGAGTTTWTLMTNLLYTHTSTHSYGGEYSIEGVQAADIEVTDSKMSYLELDMYDNGIGMDVSPTARVRYHNVTVASANDTFGNVYFAPGTQRVLPLTLTVEMENVRAAGGVGFDFYTPTSDIVTYNGYMKDCTVYNTATGGWLAGGYVTLGNNMNMQFEDNYLYNGFKASANVPLVLMSSSVFRNNRNYQTGAILTYPTDQQTVFYQTMTTTQRNQMNPLPVVGMVIYNITESKLNVYTPLGWQAIALTQEADLVLSVVDRTTTSENVTV
jgi:hypothetical protein